MSPLRPRQQPLSVQYPRRWVNCEWSVVSWNMEIRRTNWLFLFGEQIKVQYGIRHTLVIADISIHPPALIIAQPTCSQRRLSISCNCMVSTWIPLLRPKTQQPREMWRPFPHHRAWLSFAVTHLFPSCCFFSSLKFSTASSFSARKIPLLIDEPSTCCSRGISPQLEINYGRCGQFILSHWN